MQCPLCLDESLEPHVRSGVEVDVCPRCRGVWMDRGEIDKLSDPAPITKPPKQRSSSDRSYSKRDRDDRGEKRNKYSKDYKKRDDDDDDNDKRRKRKKGFASRLADVLEDIID